MSSRFYRSFEEFAREEIRPMTRANWTFDDLDIDSNLGGDDFSFADKDDDESEEE